LLSSGVRVGRKIWKTFRTWKRSLGRPDAMSETPRDTGFEEHRREQRRAWLRLTYLQRLEWLEQAKRFAARALEAARIRAERGR
jgi:hypothetical protein